MNYKLLTELIPYIEEFEKKKKGASMEDFISWMHKDPTIKAAEPAQVDSDHSRFIPLQGGINAQICQLIALLHKYVRFYFKKGMKDTLLQTTEDFGFLASLATYGDLRKNELIQKNTSEFTSGMEVIRRLERNKFIVSFSDKEDKRAKRVRITELGQKAFVEALPILRNIGEVATGQLSNIEKESLLKLLSNLNDFHNPIFHDEKESPIEKIIEDYVSK